jgi:hypothetical protein
MMMRVMMSAVLRVAGGNRDMRNRSAAADAGSHGSRAVMMVVVMAASTVPRGGTGGGRVRHASNGIPSGRDGDGGARDAPLATNSHGASAVVMLVVMAVGAGSETTLGRRRTSLRRRLARTACFCTRHAEPARADSATEPGAALADVAMSVARDDTDGEKLAPMSLTRLVARLRARPGLGGGETFARLLMLIKLVTQNGDISTSGSVAPPFSCGTTVCIVRASAASSGARLQSMIDMSSRRARPFQAELEPPLVMLIR